MEKRRAAQEFDAIQMVEGEDPVAYFTRIDKAVQRLAMLGCNKDDDEVNVHVVQNLSALYNVENKILLASSTLTRSGIEEMVRNAYISEKSEVEKGRGSKGVDPHALYAGGDQPAGAGGGGKGKLKYSKSKKQQQLQQQQQQQQPALRQRVPRKLGDYFSGPIDGGEPQ